MNTARFRVLLVLAAFLLAPVTARGQSAVESIRVNQIGFYPDGPKAAVVVGATGSVFEIRTAAGGETVYTSALGAAKTWSPSGEVVRLADFGALAQTGNFVVHVPGVGDSHPFEIAPGVHADVARGALKAYYYMRASTRLHPRYATYWARAAGHPDTEVLVHPSAATPERPAGTLISAPKGWYDAGDYNKYVVNAGISTGTLLMLYEHYPEYYDALDLNIPESGNGVPDLLDEILWNLRWMLAMQDPNDGGVYNKLTNPNFEGIVMPSRATQPRYVVQKGTAATLDFAAVTALAARLYDDFEDELPGLSDSLLAASQSAWAWALDHQEMPYDQGAMNAQFDPDIHTGGYGDNSFFDEFRWAAAELFLTTGETWYVEAFNPTGQLVDVPGWPNVGALAYYSLAHHREAAAAVFDTTQVMSRIVTRANALVNGRRESAYGVVMGSTGGFYWGSNSQAANEAMLLLQAYAFTREDRYLEAAQSNLDYLLGRNATGYSFLTGFGDKTPMHPHHRPSEADAVDDPVPGLLVGGPNPGRQDGCTYPSSQPAKAYVDDWCSYASNEITINWNAPLAYVAGAVEAIRSPTGRPVDAERGAVPLAAPRLAVSAYPNPAHTGAFVAFELPEAATVSVTVYDVLGRAVARPAERMTIAAGRHTVPVDVAGLAAGAYLVRVDAGAASSSRVLHVVGE